MVFFDQFLQDCRYGLRQLRRDRPFGVAAVVMLAVGIGLSTTAYTIVNGLLIRGWSVPNPETLFRPQVERRVAAGADGSAEGYSLAAYRFIHGASSHAEYVAYLPEDFDLKLEAGGPRLRTAGVFATSNFVRFLRLRVQLGVDLDQAESDVNRVLISHRLWSRVFAKSPDAVGRQIWVNDAPVIVGGVMPTGFEGLGRNTVDLVVSADDSRRSPLVDMAPPMLRDESKCCVFVAGRRRDTSTLDAAGDELQALTAQHRGLAGQPPVRVRLGSTTEGAQLLRNEAEVVAGLAVVSVATVLVLILTWANVSNLFLAKSLKRRHEIGARLALGASRGRLIRQLLTEGLVLALVGGGVSCTASIAAPWLLRAFQEEADARLLAFDWRVAAFAAALIGISCVAVALAPALQATRMSVSRPGVGGSLRGTLLFFQVAVAVLLVVGASLLTRSTIYASSLPQDFARDSSTVGVIELASAVNHSAERRRHIRDALLRLADDEGFAIGVVDSLPVEVMGLGRSTVREPGSDEVHVARVLPLSARGAEVLELSVNLGRWSSDLKGSKEAVVNQTFAEQAWHGESPLGRSLAVDLTGDSYVVVGVVRDAHLTSFDRVDPVVHISPMETGGMLPTFVGRSTPEFRSRLEAIVHSVDSSLVLTVTPLRQALELSLREATVAAAIAASLSFVAVTLAVAGVFSVFSCVVADRRQEIGVRLALGASRRHIRSALFRATRAPLLLGLLAGGTAAFLGAALLRSLLMGLSPLDPISYLAASLIIGLAGIASVAVPLRRALSIGPITALRSE